MDGKIALEEHWAIGETIDITGQPVRAGPVWDELRRLLVEFRDERLASMDANGIGFVILGLNSPALQAVLDPAEAVEIAHRANDTLANEIAHNSNRFAGFAGLPMQDPEAAARELARCVKELGFKGAMANCFTQRDVADSAIYYDLPEFRPFWATVAELHVPFYLHPRLTIPSRAKAYEGHSWLYSPAWDFGSETATQALRLIGSGLFDEFPGLQIVLGHLGERIPFDMWRIDARVKVMPFDYPCARPVSAYLRENFHITTSGFFSDPAMLCCLQEMGADRIMFAIDYPFVPNDPGPVWMERLMLNEEDKDKILHGNAEKLLKL